jgi:outer membrane protein assembly factor BamB
LADGYGKHTQVSSFLFVRTSVDNEASKIVRQDTKGRGIPCRTDGASSYGVGASVASVWVAGIVSLIIAGLLTGNWIEMKFVFPLREKKLLEMRQAWAKNPTNEQLAADARTLDERLRAMRITRQSFARYGAWGLLAFAAIAIVALKVASRYRTALPMPHLDPDAAARQIQAARNNRYAVAAGLVILGLAWLVLYLIPSPQYPDSATAGMAPTDPTTSQVPSGTNTQKPSPPQPTAHPSPDKPAIAPPTLDELKANWPSFRGFDGSGVSPFADIPAEWDGESGKNIAWKTSLEGLLHGNNSPVIWGDRLYFSGATQKAFQIYCFSVADGKLLWKTDVPSLDKAPEPLELGEETGYASSTMAVDNARAYAIFSTGDIAAVDPSGKLLWNKYLGRPESTYGYVASLAVFQGRLIVQYDQGAVEDKLSKLIALDGATGNVVWQTPRPVANSWSSPVVVPFGNAWQLIATADPLVAAYNPADGKELWRAQCISGDVTPSPIVAAGKVLAIEPYNAMVAVKADGTGDVSKTHVTPIGDLSIPDVTSPVSDGRFVWLLTTEGVLTCYDIRDAAPAPIDDAHKKNPRFRWEHEFQKESFHASPVLIGQTLYLLSAKGRTYRVAAAETFQQIGVSSVPDKFSASPAFLSGRIFIRGSAFLWCIQAPK